MSLSVDTVRSALRVTGKAVLADAEPEWTTRILQTLAGLAEPNMYIDPDVSAAAPGKGRRAKEFLWDLTISSFPRYGAEGVGYRYPAYFEAARTPKLLLVAESEWGDQRSPRQNGHAVLEDFVKLLAARAPLKVMVFGYHEGSARDTNASSSFVELTLIVVAPRPTHGLEFAYASIAETDREDGELLHHVDIVLLHANLQAAPQGRRMVAQSVMDRRYGGAPRSGGWSTLPTTHRCYRPERIRSMVTRSRSLQTSIPSGRQSCRKDLGRSSIGAMAPST